jgi:hypothetical protein
LHLKGKLDIFEKFVISSNLIDGFYILPKAYYINSVFHIVVTCALLCIILLKSRLDSSGPAQDKYKLDQVWVLLGGPGRKTSPAQPNKSPSS